MGWEMEFKDYYSILGVERGASEDEIRRSYRKLARKYHPDVSKESDAEARMRDVNEAYDVLRDKEKREAYDNLAAGVSPGGASSRRRDGTRASSSTAVRRRAKRPSSASSSRRCSAAAAAAARRARATSRNSAPAATITTRPSRSTSKTLCRAPPATSACAP